MSPRLRDFKSGTDCRPLSQGANVALMQLFVLILPRAARVVILVAVVVVVATVAAPSDSVIGIVVEVVWCGVQLLF